MSILYPAENTEIAHWAKTNEAFLPPIRFDCGKEDALLDANRKLHATLLEQGVAHTYEENDGGHTWEYWQTHIRSTLRFISSIEEGGWHSVQAFDAFGGH